MATTKAKPKTTKKPEPRARRETETVTCPHCGEEWEVSENGRYLCDKCEGLCNKERGESA